MRSAEKNGEFAGYKFFDKFCRVTSMGRIKNENVRRRSVIERERKRARNITESE